MRTIHLSMFVLGIMVPIAVYGPSARVAWSAEVWSVTGLDQSDGKLNFQLDGQALATYSYRDDAISRPYFCNVTVPGGHRVTRNHPPQPGDRQDHAEFHPGLWLAFGDLSGSDNWRLRAPVRHVRFVEEPRAIDKILRFVVENDYLSDDGMTIICRETCRYELHADDHSVLLIWDSTFGSDGDEFYFGDQEEMGLGVRLATPIAVSSNQGGRILDSEGRINEKQVWGTQSAWCDYAGTVNNQFIGMMLMPHPSNFRPCWYHARDYGFVAANPFGRNAFTRGEKSKVVVRKDKPFSLRYGVLIHWNQRAEEFDPQRGYQRFLSIVK